MKTHRDDILLAGAWQRVEHTIDVENPTTTTIVGTGAAAGSREVDAAISAARAALPHWSTTGPTERAEHIEALTAVLRERRDELIELTVAEVGAPIDVVGPWHVDVALDILESAAAHARTFTFDQQHGALRLIRRAAGVAALITPWNYPFYQLAAKAGSALAAGCTMVHKPSELTPLSAYLFAEATVEAGLPPGVHNLVPGTGLDVGAALAAHPGVDIVSFTGSTTIGQKVAAQAVAHTARVTLELGGKSASIVCDDADLPSAVQTSVESCMLNSGQTCSSWTRLLVPEDHLDEAVEIAARRADAMVLGDPTQAGIELGPLISRTQLDKVADMIQGAIQRGARVATDPARAVPPTGHYIAPTVLVDVDVQDPISQEEIFGPVLIVHGYRDDAHALQIANGTPYGLAGAIWSKDPERASTLAARMDTGQVFINGADFSVEAPFGGWKRSGFGREFGLEGLLEFTELTAVHT